MSSSNSLGSEPPTRTFGLMGGGNGQTRDYAVEETLDAERPVAGNEVEIETLYW
ncbi:hypothetical protein JOB18_020313 [Solea senegalensis]|uniref:Uncharacterized protein n=1 Tax=Solea senegalensis TaxID=28829 RepID=A0AAV6RT92_SOLSE|nr:hypothetical protein JOB18_020313 [Solea senegalensis]